jgi:hypothetical protein
MTTEATLKRLQDERVAQGLPRHVTDGATLDRIAFLIEGTVPVVSAKKKRRP